MTHPCSCQPVRFLPSAGWYLYEYNRLLEMSSLQVLGHGQNSSNMLHCCSFAKLCLTLAIPWAATHQASQPFTISWSLLKLMSIKSMMPSNHLILCHPLLLLPSIFPSIRVFSSESALRIRWPKYWSFSFSIGPSNEQSGLTFFRIDLLIYQCQTCFEIISIACKEKCFDIYQLSLEERFFAGTT